jgi:tRNA-binding EMAP/Myf-like protein
MPKANKLLILKVDTWNGCKNNSFKFANIFTRRSGWKTLHGFLVNLAPRALRGVESHE